MYLNFLVFSAMKHTNLKWVIIIIIKNIGDNKIIKYYKIIIDVKYFKQIYYV